MKPDSSPKGGERSSQDAKEAEWRNPGPFRGRPDGPDGPDGTGESANDETPRRKVLCFADPAHPRTLARCPGFVDGSLPARPDRLALVRRTASTIEGDEFKAARDRIRRIQLGLGPNDPLPEEDDETPEMVSTCRPFSLFLSFTLSCWRGFEAANVVVVDAHGKVQPKKRLVRRSSSTSWAPQSPAELSGEVLPDCHWGEWQEPWSIAVVFGGQWIGVAVEILTNHVFPNA
eukprot:s158_g1.t1